MLILYWRENYPTLEGKLHFYRGEHGLAGRGVFNT